MRAAWLADARLAARVASGAVGGARSRSERTMRWPGTVDSSLRRARTMAWVASGVVPAGVARCRPATPRVSQKRARPARFAAEAGASMVRMTRMPWALAWRREMVEVVEVGHGAVAAGSGEGGRGKQQGIDAEGAQGVEADGEGFEVDRGGRRDLIEDGVTPPGVGAGAGSGEAGAGHALGGEAARGCQQQSGEEQGGEGQETAMGPVRRGRAVRGRARPGVGGGDRHR